MENNQREKTLRIGLTAVAGLLAAGMITAVLLSMGRGFATDAETESWLETLES